jgi:hypothetical protein
MIINGNGLSKMGNKFPTVEQKDIDHACTIQYNSNPADKYILHMEYACSNVFEK